MRFKDLQISSLMFLILIMMFCTSPTSPDKSTPANNPPVANDDAFNVNQNSSGNALDVLANDTDPDSGDTLTITSVGTPDQDGTVTINGTSDGLIYTPASGFTGTETFTYTIQDAAGASDQATVTVTATIPQPNKAPMVQDLEGSVSCAVGSTHKYRARGYDPDGSKVSIKFEWEYYTTSGWKKEESEWSSVINNNTWVTHSITWKNATDWNGEWSNGTVRAYIKDNMGKKGYFKELDITFFEGD